MTAPISPPDNGARSTPGPAAAEPKPKPLLPLLYGVEDRPPLVAALAYAGQWVLVMFYAVVWGFAIVGVGLGFDDAQLADYMSRVVLVVGLTTLVQALAGHRMAMISGPGIISSLAIVTAVQAGGVDYALQSFNAMIVAGVIVATVTLLGLHRHLERVWSPLVLGSMIMMIGLAVAPRGVALLTAYGFDWTTLVGVGLALLTGWLSLRGRRTLASLSIGIVVVAGYAVFMLTGRFDWAAVRRMPPLVLPSVFPFGLSPPPIDLVLVMTLMALVMSVTLYGNLQAYGSLVGQRVDWTLRRRALIVLGLVETTVAGAFGVPGHVPYSENLGIVTLTRVASRYTIIIAGAILAGLAFVGPMTGLMAAMPKPLAGAVLLGVASTVIGIGGSTWSRAPSFGPRDQFIVSFALFLSLGLFLAPAEALAELPQIVRTLATNPVIMVVAIAIVLEQLVLPTPRADGGRRATPAE